MPTFRPKREGGTRLAVPESPGVGGVKLRGKYEGSGQHFTCPQSYFKKLSFYSLIEHLLYAWGFTYVTDSS